MALIHAMIMVQPIQDVPNLPSYIRRGKYCPAATPPPPPPPPPSCIGDPSWILKRDGLNSSGQRRISLNSKTKGIALKIVTLYNFLEFLKDFIGFP